MKRIYIYLVYDIGCEMFYKFQFNTYAEALNFKDKFDCSACFSDTVYKSTIMEVYFD